MHKYTYGKKSKVSKKGAKKAGGLLFLLIGLGALVYFFFPLLSFHIYFSSGFAGNNIEAPLPKRLVLRSDNSLANLFSAQIANASVDYKDARNWFPNAHQREVGESIKEFELSIPKQGIFHAKVSAESYDLSKNLVQYFTTSEDPTDFGTSVIFGHSSLPQWFDPSNYTTIFAKMHLLGEGDEVILTVNGRDYKYKIFEKSIMNSTDPNIFSQSFDNSYLTLVTCTPPGTTWKRLIVRASLVEE